ncbi:MAG: hypothetical protein NVSMB1_00200 [Polyangiales bacterium]
MLALSLPAFGCTGLLGENDDVIPENATVSADGSVSTLDETSSTGTDPSETGETTTDPDDGGPTGTDAPLTLETPVTPPVVALVKDLAIAELALNQAVKVPLMKDGAKVTIRNAPVVVGKGGLFRVYVKPGATWTPRMVDATLQLTSAKGSPMLNASAMIATASSEDKLDSTINFEVPGDAIQLDTSFTVTLRTTGQISPASSAGAAYPTTGADALNAKSSGESLKIKIVPYRYNADGTHRLPDTSPGRLGFYAAVMSAMYPVQKVEVTLHPPLDWAGAFTKSSGFDPLLTDLATLRETEKAPGDVYYYGIISPSADYVAFCSGACVAGLGFLAPPGESFPRAAAGLDIAGIPASELAKIIRHEIGHNHGRQHLPCGITAGPFDPSPYAGGLSGGFGYDSITKSLTPPTAGDVMGYCNPTWISDYTYNALFTRIASVNGAPASIIIPPGEPTRYRAVHVNAAGELKWQGDSFDITHALFGESHSVTYQRADGSTFTTTGHFYTYGGGEVQGGDLLVPVSSTPFVSMTVKDLLTAGSIKTIAQP